MVTELKDKNDRGDRSPRYDKPLTM
jgi:hypothetical protein